MTFKSLSILPDITNSIFTDRFNKIDKLFSKLTGDIPVNTLPSYDVKKKNNTYNLIISLPGWSEKELEINTIKEQITIIGRKKELHTEILKKEWIYKGIKKNNFKISYSLPQYIKVKEAKLKNGLLTIKFEQEIPEHEKPKKINILSEQK